MKKVDTHIVNLFFVRKRLALKKYICINIEIQVIRNSKRI